MQTNIEAIRDQIKSLRDQGHALAKRSRGWKFGGDSAGRDSEAAFRQANDIEGRYFLVLNPRLATAENIAFAMANGLPLPSGL